MADAARPTRPCSTRPRPSSPTHLGSARSVADPLGTAFDALLAGRYDHAGGLGTYLTPSAVARMMAEVAMPLVEASPVDGRPGFGDPFCGTGRFLVALLAALPAELIHCGQPARSAPTCRPRRWPRPASTCCSTASSTRWSGRSATR